MDLEHKTALVTGGATGIGAAIAKSLSSLGVRVMIAGRRRELLEATAQEIEKSGGRVSMESCDVREFDQCSTLVESALREFGHLDILVNNAGVLGHGKLMADYTPGEWNAIMDTNVRSVFFLVKSALPGMVARKSGDIVNISSVSGIRYYGGESLYGISKHALNALTNFIAEEYGPQGIRAVAICPGLTRTEMGLSLKPIRHERLLLPEDIADAVIWALTRRPASKIASPIVLEPIADPWDGTWSPTANPD